MVKIILKRCEGGKGILVIIYLNLKVVVGKDICFLFGEKYISWEVWGVGYCFVNKFWVFEILCIDYDFVSFIVLGVGVMWIV